MAYEWGFTTSPEEEWAQAVQEFYRLRTAELEDRPDEPVDLWPVDCE